MEIIDTHPHVIAAPTGQYPHAPVGGEQSRWSQGVEVTGDFLRTVMDAAGVSQAVVVQTSTVYGYDNRFIADTVAAGGGRFAGVCSVNPVAPSGADDLSYWISERGLSGVRLFSTGSEIGRLFTLDDPRLVPVWERAESLGVPVDVQVKYPALPVVGQIARRYPGLRIVLDHIGGAPVAGGPPYTDAADLFALADCEQVYVKFSGHNLDAAASGPSSAGEFIAALVRSFGAGRLAWGSNFPNSFGRRPATADAYRLMLDQGLSAIAGLGPADQQAIMAGTPRALYAGLAEAAK